MKILVISGGTSSERKISLISGKAVKTGLEEAGYQVKIFDLKKDYTTLKNLAKYFDVIFPVIHGEEGEGGELHKFLAKLGKPYVGGNWKNFKKGWYKIPFKKFCQKNNLPTSSWKEVKTLEQVKRFGLPCVVKASAGGSSKEVIIVKTHRDLLKLPKLLMREDKFLVERYLPGVELTVGILDNQALPVLEIVPPDGKWFDYKNKYSGVSQEIPNAPSLTNKERLALQGEAFKIHQMLNLGPYSRIDFIVSEGIPYVLEVNTIPGLTSESLFPKAAKAAGISFPNLVKMLVEISLAKFKK